MNSIVTRAARRERASELPARCSELSNHEAGNVIQAFPAIRHLNIGRASSDDRLRSNLRLENHSPHLRVTLRESAALAAGFIVLLVTAWLIWAALAEAVSAMAPAA